MIKLGVNSVLFGGFDFPTAARHIAMAGYDGVELSAIKGMCEHLVLDRWREQVDAIRKAAADNKLALLSMEVTSLEDDRAIPGIEAAEALGIPVVNFGPGGKSKNKEDLDRQAGIIDRLAGIAAKHGVTVCVKAHVGACVDDTPTTQVLMKRIQGPGFGVDMDPSHIYRAGEDPAKALSAVIKRVRHIHIRDCKGKGPGPWDAAGPGLRKRRRRPRRVLQGHGGRQLRRSGLPGGDRCWTDGAGAGQHHSRRELRLSERGAQASREALGSEKGKEDRRAQSKDEPDLFRDRQPEAGPH